MTTEEAITFFDGKVRKLADALGITEQAIYQWGGQVPELRVYQIKAILQERGA